MFASIATKLFGTFSREELKKFLMLGALFTLIIGVYWVLLPLKDSIFMSIVGKEYIPMAQMISMACLVPLIIVYSMLVDRLSRQAMLYVLASFYGLGAFCFGLFFWHPVIGLANTITDSSRIVGWLWYFFVESYGSLMIALFWAFVTDITEPQSAKKGFSLIVMLGQFGSIFAPLILTPLAGPGYWGSSLPLVFIVSAFIFSIIPFVRFFMMIVPSRQLKGYHPELTHIQKKNNHGFLRGFILICSHPYLLGILAITLLQGALVTVIDIRFKYLVGHTILTESARTVYLGNYAVWVNAATFACLLFGVSNITRRLGIKYALLLMPCIIAGAMLAVCTAPEVSVLFIIMVVAKAFNYALNAPAVKELYVPTSHDAKYKSQAWIETFGSRGSQVVGSGVIMVQNLLYGILGCGLFGFYSLCLISITCGSLSAWFGTAYFLANTYQKAVDHDRVVC